MTDRNNGGPAFPIKGRGAFDLELVQAEGMSLRDWFAGQALVGITAHPTNNDAEGGAFFAGEAYRMADAMIAARSEAKP